MDPKTREGVYASLFVVLIGCVCLWFAMREYNLARPFVEHGVTVPGSVIETWTTTERGSKGKSKTVYHAKVSFHNAQGQSDITETRARLNQGEVVHVTYLPENPHDARVNFLDHPYQTAQILLGIGTLVGAIGIWLAIHCQRKRQRILWLIARGEKILAKVKDIEHHFSNSRRHRTSSRSSRRTYTIHAEWINPTSGKLCRFCSHRLRSDPGDHLLGAEVGVFINSADPSEYYMEVPW